MWQAWRALRIVYGDYNKYLTNLYQTTKNLEIFGTEIHSKNEASPEITFFSVRNENEKY